MELSSFIFWDKWKKFKKTLFEKLEKKKFQKNIPHMSYSFLKLQKVHFFRFIFGLFEVCQLKHDTLKFQKKHEFDLYQLSYNNYFYVQWRDNFFWACFKLAFIFIAFFALMVQLEALKRNFLIKSLADFTTLSNLLNKNIRCLIDEGSKVGFFNETSLMKTLKSLNIFVF